MQHHRRAYAALAAVYLVTAAILILDRNIPHGCCALAVAAIYAALCLASQAPARAVRAPVNGFVSLWRKLWRRGAKS
jgi:NADH:ubiquinone oxidoreductase subunit 6 (subunit J)